MPDVIRCPGCNKLNRISEELMAQQVQCPSCGTTFRPSDLSTQVTSTPPAPTAYAPRLLVEEFEPGAPSERGFRDRGEEDFAFDARSDYTRRVLPAELPGSGAAVAACLLLVVSAVIHAASFLHEQATLDLLARAPVGLAEAEAHDARGMMLALLGLGVLIPLVVTFCVWMHKAYANLQVFRLHGLRFTPGWAVGYWFIPFANLFRPCQVMQEIWRGSSPHVPPPDANAWRSEPGSVAIGFWWAAWLIGNILATIGTRMTMGLPPGIEQLRQATQLLLISEVASIIAAVLVIFIVLGIRARQREKLLQLRSAPALDESAWD